MQYLNLLIDIYNNLLPYLFVSLIFLFITCLIRGFTASDYTKRDIIDALFWPLTLTVIAGVALRVIFNIITSPRKKENNEIE